MDIDPTPVTNWLLLLVALFSVAGTVIVSFTWVARKRDAVAKERDEALTAFILQVTKPIQPGTNGGLSLTDLHDKVDGLTDAVVTVVTSHIRIQDEQEVIIADLVEVKGEQARIAVELAAYKDGQLLRENP